MITYGSVCSGIEAVTVAVKGMEWTPVYFSEISEFPRALLKHHYPHVFSIRDMKELLWFYENNIITAPDVFVGGTPCQSFSVAGLGGGLSDPRGLLTKTFVEIGDAIDEKRPGNESVLWWENVKGVLTSKDNAFGCFLGALAGERCELQPPGGKWQNAGCVLGPKRAIAWRVLDAQYFGLAQRRKRLFVVASARKGFDPTAVLFERKGLRRDTPPKSRPYPTLDCGVWRKRQSNQWVRNGFAIVRAGQVTNPTITEIERLQGFPDGYTDIPWTGNNILAERYSAIGNSMPVPVIRWLAGRIEKELLS